MQQTEALSNSPLVLRHTECQKLRKEKRALVAENEKLRTNWKRSEKQVASEQIENRHLSVQISRQETKSQEDRLKIQKLVRKIELQANEIKAKDSEIRILNSKVKKMADAQKELLLQNRGSRPNQVKCEAQIEMEEERQISSPLVTVVGQEALKTRHQRPLGRLIRSASNTCPAHNNELSTQEKGEERRRTTGYNFKKAEWIFWMTADEYSGAEVISQVERLNSEMLQVAASLADDLDLENQMKGGEEPDKTTEAIRRTTNLIGPHLTRMLAASKGQNIILQTAIQTGLLLHIQRIISSWCLWDERANTLLCNAHKRLYESGQFAVNRWQKQLTVRHSTTTCLRSLETTYKNTYQTN